MSIKTLIAKMGLVASLVAASAGAHAQDIKVALGTDGFVHMPLFVAVSKRVNRARRSSSVNVACLPS